MTKVKRYPNLRAILMLLGISFLIVIALGALMLRVPKYDIFPRDISYSPHEVYRVIEAHPIFDSPHLGGEIVGQAHGEDVYWQWALYKDWALIGYPDRSIGWLPLSTLQKFP